MAIVDQINRLTGGKNGNGSIEDALRILELNNGGSEGGGGSDEVSDEEIVPVITVTVPETPAGETIDLEEATIVESDLTIGELVDLHAEGKIRRVHVIVNMPASAGVLATMDEYISSIKTLDLIMAMENNPDQALSSSKAIGIDLLKMNTALNIPLEVVGAQMLTGIDPETGEPISVDEWQAKFS